MKFFGRLFYFGFLAVLLTTTAAFADDPPGRVARLEYMSGSVSVQPRGTDDWVQGSENRPLTNADNVWADKDSRAELNVGTGFLRLGAESSLTLTNVNNDSVQVSLHQGALNVHVRHLYSGEIYEIDTPNLAFTITKSGDYRFDVDPNGDNTIVTVRKGEGTATGQGPAVKVKSGDQASFTGGNSLAHQIHDAPRPDAFDDWCKVRDQREDNSVSARYVAPGVVGAGDLDENGTWRQVPDYGPVWVPTSVAPGWAPYRYGHWAWVDPWGWTWVDDAPWGFAPFHYGRWVYTGGYWGWAPGPYYVRPWYAPALVAWFGGPGWGVSFGFGFGGGFGWCPLGFGEPFYPWWGGFSRGYFRNVNISNTNITNITNITNNYFNHPGVAPYGTRGISPLPRYAANHGFTAASANTLQRGLPVNQNMAHVPESGLRNLTASARGPQVSPTHESMLGPKAGLPAAHPLSASASRPTVSRMTPPASPARTGSPTNVARGTENTVARGPETSAARGPETPANRGVQAPENRGPASSAINHAPESAVPTNHTNGATEGPGNRNVPRPPQSLSNGSSSVARNGSPSFGGREGGGVANTSHSEPTQMAMNNHYVPRPPSAMGGSRISEPIASTSTHSMGGTMSSPMGRSVPRPSGNNISRPAESVRNTMPSYSSSPRSYGTTSPSMGHGNYTVPRPSGQVRPAPNYTTSRSYGSGGSYSGSRGYSSPSSGSYGHYSAPSRSYGGGYSGGYHGGGSSSSGGYHGSSSGGYHSSSGGGSFHGGGGASHVGGHR